MYVCMSVCTYVCLCVYMYVCVYLCMCVCTCVYLYLYSAIKNITKAPMVYIFTAELTQVLV